MIGRLLTGFAAAAIEAWHELRIHKLRVLLSLIGVGVAVAAISGTVALADIGQQALKEQNERSGRPALLSTSVYSSGNEGTPVAPAQVRPAFDEAVHRYDITYSSIVASTELTAVAQPATAYVQLSVVDAPYAQMHRVVTRKGRWLTAADATNLSPAIVADTNLMRSLGLSGSSLPATTQLQAGTKQVEATIVGVTQGSGQPDEPGGTAYMLSPAYSYWFGATAPLTDASWEMWVPIPGSDQLAQEVRRTMRADLPGLQVETNRNDYLSWGGGDDLNIVKWVVVGISSVILLLGALSLLNVSLITVQQRVREIGIRRSFGATSGRVFFSVVMESIVATAVAGVVGVGIAVALVSGPWTARYVLEGIEDPPPFPLSAAALGIGVSLVVGALAGVLPALIAVRVKIIDAIRF